ncbi:DedA family protein [Williamsia sp. CHRR-6]|uniref:DedA family protein n=1 Tax=Williamsia sp. CHRR-6 TaxID=2835871 RepID=UPI001BD922AC|nr:DedA family protein [Williamsia sp. CHRR-6]MBT0565703.1 DedA family protein [Williamsia sp. CHRR-6]
MNPFDVSSFMASGGLVGLCVLIFIETGLLIGFLFPGDSLLFTAGILAAQPDPYAPLWVPCLLVPISAALGDQLGYFIGRKLGVGVMQGRLMRFIGAEPVARTHAFFERYGPLTVFFGRFIGVVRTLVPLLAGFTGMRHRDFTIFSILGSVVWGAGIIVLGYFLGGVPLIADNIDIMIMASVATVVVPLGVHLLRRGLARRRARGADREPTISADIAETGSRVHSLGAARSADADLSD